MTLIISFQIIFFALLTHLRQFNASLLNCSTSVVYNNHQILAALQGFDYLRYDPYFERTTTGKEIPPKILCDKAYKIFADKRKNTIACHLDNNRSSCTDLIYSKNFDGFTPEVVFVQVFLRGDQCSIKDSDSKFFTVTPVEDFESYLALYMLTLDFKYDCKGFGVMQTGINIMFKKAVINGNETILIQKSLCRLLVNMNKSLDDCLSRDLPDLIWFSLDKDMKDLNCEVEREISCSNMIVPSNNTAMQKKLECNYDVLMTISGVLSIFLVTQFYGC